MKTGMFNLKKNFAVASLIWLLSGCAAVETQLACTEEPCQLVPQRSLVYFMPKKDVVITVTVPAKKGPATFSIESGTAYPDPSKTFLLTAKQNLFAKNVLHSTVSANGLLTQANATLTSKVTESFQNLADTFVELKAAIDQSDRINRTCPPGNYTNVVDIEAHVVGTWVTAKGNCPFYFKISRKFNIGEQSQGVYEQTKAHAGVYYRTPLPYLVYAELPYIDGKQDAVVKQQLIMSPTESPTHLLPANRTFFANNTTDVGLTDGMVKSYNSDTDSEIAALFGFPAQILTHYAKAVGAVLTREQTETTSEKNLLNSLVELEKAKAKYALCRGAVIEGDDAKIKIACN